MLRVADVLPWPARLPAGWCSSKHSAGCLASPLWFPTGTWPGLCGGANTRATAPGKQAEQVTPQWLAVASGSVCWSQPARSCCVDIAVTVMDRSSCQPTLLVADLVRKWPKPRKCEDVSAVYSAGIPVPTAADAGIICDHVPTALLNCTLGALARQWPVSSQQPHSHSNIIGLYTSDSGGRPREELPSR